jgi:Conserved hypothetical protein 2217 (DUF2460)
LRSSTRAGRARGFRFKDWKDYQAVAQPLQAIGGGNYQLVKQYVSGGITYTRVITKPVAGAITLPTAARSIQRPASLPAALAAMRHFNSMCLFASISTRWKSRYRTSRPTNRVNCLQNSLNRIARMMEPVRIGVELRLSPKVVEQRRKAKEKLGLDASLIADIVHRP